MSNLRDLIREHFSEDELRDLLFDLEIDYEDLPASLGKASKVRELILLFERTGRVPELIAAVSGARPNVEWPEASRLLSEKELLGDAAIPQLPHEPELIGVPEGPFLMGSERGNESPQHEVEVPAFWIGKFPVTNKQYAVFVKETRRAAPKKVGWFGISPPHKKLDHPVVAVSWHDCVAYCTWLSEQTGRNYRLPTEAEWEKAARGTDGWIYPWGNEWDDARGNFHGRDTTPAGSYPAGASPYGCLDMLGNVWEWTLTLWGEDWLVNAFPYPYVAGDGRNDVNADRTVNRIFRGGSYAETAESLRCSIRRWYAPDHADPRRGFRVALTR